MDSKLKIIELISEGLDSGKITEGDLRSLLASRSTKQGDSSATGKTPSATKTSAVDIMFYIAGIILFASIMALISQLWSNGPILRIALSAGVGLSFWAVSLYFIQSSKKSDIQRGLTNSLLLTGALLLIAGGFLIANEFVRFYNFEFYAATITLALLGAAHMLFGWQIKRDIITLLGVLLAVLAFPSLVSGLLEGTNMPLYVYSLIAAVSGGILAYATRVASWVGLGSKHMARAFDSLSSFVVLMSLYIASYDSGSGIIWLLALIAGIIGLFYVSIALQDKYMLTSGSFFLVIAIITISVRYFSDNIAISLMISAAGLLGTAITASAINRRYIK